MPRAKDPPRVLETEELEAILALPNTKCPTGLRNRALLELLSRGAGLRLSEALALRPSAIKWRAAEVEIRAGKGHKRRTVPLGKEALDWLRAWRDERPKKAQLFFCTLQGKPVMHRYVQALVRRLAEKALGAKKGKGVSPNVLRHTYAAGLLADGRTIPEVQRLLGHADIGSTRVYAAVRPGGTVARLGTGQARAEAEKLAAKIAALPAETRRQLAGLLQG